MDVNKTNFEPENEVRRKGGFRDESSHLYVVNIGKYLFLFPEEEFDKLGSIDRKTIWDTINYVIANGITNSNKKDDEDELVFDMYELIALSHSIALPPITLKVDFSIDRDISETEFNTLYNDIPYHVIAQVMEKCGEYRLYIDKAIWERLNEDQTDKIYDKFGYISYSGCDKHDWFIDTECDLINFFNIIIFDVMPNHRRNSVVEEVEHRGGFKDPQTGEYVLNPFPYVFVLPVWFEDLEDSCRDNIYDICNQIATDPNQPKSNSTGSFTYKWDDIMACMGKYSFTQRKQYDGPGAMEQLMERETNDGKLYTVDTTNEGWISFNSKFNVNGLKVNVKREVWDKLYPNEQSSLMEAFEYILVAYKEAKIYRQLCWNLTTDDSVYYFTKYALEDPLFLTFRVVIDNDIYRAYDKVSIRSAVFDFTTCNVESLLFVIGSDDFFKSLSSSNMSAINNEIDRISKLNEEERYLEFGTRDFTFYYNCGKFYGHKPEQIIPELEGADTMIGGFNGTTFYVTDNDEIVKENMYEDEVRGERCKILKFTAKRNGIYFFSIEMAAWNVLDAVVEDMLITKARIVSKIGCSAHIWHFNSVGAIEEFLNIPVKDEKNLLGLNKPNPIKEENTMFNKFPLKKKNNDNLPKKEANPTMPTPEQAKVILDAMYACQADTTKYAEDMRRDRARANAVMARAVLTHGILTGDQMASRNFKLPKDVKYPYAIRVADDELVVVTNEKPATEQVLDTTNSVPVTNLQDYANMLSTFILLKETHEGLTSEEAASVVTNYIACRDQSLLEMLQETNSLEKVIGEGTVREIENTEYSNLMITSPTVMKYITILPADEDDKK